MTTDDDERGATMTLAERYEQAITRYETDGGSSDAAEEIVEIENEICDLLDIPLNETEQGLSRKAVEIIDAWRRDEATKREEHDYEVASSDHAIGISER